MFVGVPFRAHYQHMVSLALVHLADQDVGVRATAYRLLNSLAATLQLPIATRLQVRNLALLSAFLVCGVLNLYGSSYFYYVVQETPCVLVPSNCSRLLTPLVTALVRFDPLLLTTLVPKVLDIGNITLVDALQVEMLGFARVRETYEWLLFTLVTLLDHPCCRTAGLRSVRCPMMPGMR